jgi:hypothetical protein
VGSLCISISDILLTLNTVDEDVYVYLSNIYQRSHMRIYWFYFSLSPQHVSVPSGHLQVKYNSLLIYLEKAIDISTDPLFHNLSLIIYL